MEDFEANICAYVRKCPILKPGIVIDDIWINSITGKAYFNVLNFTPHILEYANYLDIHFNYNGQYNVRITIEISGFTPIY